MQETTFLVGLVNLRNDYFNQGRQDAQGGRNRFAQIKNDLLTSISPVTGDEIAELIAEAFTQTYNDGFADGLIEKEVAQHGQAS